MKKPVAPLLHIGFWVCYSVLVMVILGALFGSDDKASEARIAKAFQIILFFAVVPSVISFYSFYFLLFPKDFQRKTIALSFIYGALISLASATIGYFILTKTVGDNCGQNETIGTTVGIILFMSFIASINGVIALVIKGFITWFEEIKLKEFLKQKTHETELALVKSQLDPHFLFNTINNIDVLILKNATEASNYLNALSDIMRFILYETKEDRILLSKEIEYIEKYVALQKIRTSNAHYVNFAVTGTSLGKTIAPMVFIPFIENAFKHTTNKKVENAISIAICIKSKSVEFTCENKFNPNAKKQQECNGLGNDLIQKRLTLLYPAKHQLEVMNQNDIYRVKLSIDNG